ncbi:MAG TPA: tetratricopeptide repeat protein [Gemmatimonas sp.]|uniref:tetratricopeptide repeat protein n=1 Tax=Gemmatimonas sp. TaxID=1962908 RepID=UPI002ED7CEBE
MRRAPLAAVSLLACLAACTPKPESDADLVARGGAPVFQGMGAFHRVIDTKDAGAQRYFDQGMMLAFGFNHAEAIRSFRAAQKLDPQCAMCFWGEALATGPNINVTSKGKAIMSADEQRAAWAALTKAQALAASKPEKEQALITALAARYAAEPVDDRTALDHAYATAMGDLVKKYPDDDDMAALYGEAWMNTMPWNYWSDATTPRPEIVPVIAALESTIARSPKHPLALHLYIHAMEASATPEKAEKASDALLPLAPGSGHLVHMPSHIYWRVGRYNDAAKANIDAAKIDEEYIKQCNAQGFYPAMYYPHNIHFLWSAASMQGQSKVAIEAGRKLADNVSLAQIDQFPTVEFFKTIPLLSLVQFARWDEILAEPQPRTDLGYSNAIWHYARGVALANKGDLAGAKNELTALTPLKANAKVMVLDGNDYPASKLLQIAEDLLQGEIALAGGNSRTAITEFTAAVAGQDALPYTEPPFWYYPTRQSLGAALLKAGQAKEAQAVYEKDLQQYPHNGWSTFGLAQALEAQGKSADAATQREHFKTMWQFADVELKGSRIGASL